MLVFFFLSFESSLENVACVIEMPMFKCSSTSFHFILECPEDTLPKFVTDDIESQLSFDMTLQVCIIQNKTNSD